MNQFLAVCQQIDEYEIVIGTQARHIDPERTKDAIAAALDIPPEGVFALEDFEDQIEDHAVYPDLLPGEHAIDAAAVANINGPLGDHEARTFEGTIIPDWRGTEFFIKTDGRWDKEKVDHIGVSLPNGAILPDDLTADQRAEIVDQAEGDRIASLTADQRAAEMTARLEAAADEAVRLAQRAQIQGTPFNSSDYYDGKKDEIEKKYA
jgi:hypothetical protein